jgi:hypothetical protein
VQPARIFANLSVPDIGEARDFYVDYLGLGIEGLNLGGNVININSPGRVISAALSVTRANLRR